MRKTKTSVTIRQEEYKEQGSAILNDAVDLLLEKLEPGDKYEIVIRKKS